MLVFPTGDYYWNIHNDVIVEGYPREISLDWDTLEGNLDAAFTLPNDDTFFFKV